MTTETSTETLTLAEMQKTPAHELRTISLTARCRYYSTACSQMAAAADAYAVARSLAAAAGRQVAREDLENMFNHVERAKRAYTLSQEVEADRCKRTGRDIAARELAAAAR